MGKPDNQPCDELPEGRAQQLANKEWTAMRNVTGTPASGLTRRMQNTKLKPKH